MFGQMRSDRVGGQEGASLQWNDVESRRATGKGQGAPSWESTGGLALSLEHSSLGTLGEVCRT